MKSLTILSSRKDTIPNQDINMYGTKTFQILTPQLAKIRPGFKVLINEAEDGHNDYTDTSRTDKEDYVDNLKSIKDKNIDDKYKDDNLQHHNSNESVINKNKEEEALIGQLMSMNFPLKVIH